MTIVSAGPQLVDGRYRLEEVLGTGGAAVVRRAYDERLNRDVAIKLFHPGTTDEQRRTGELSLMASLTHPALVRMYDAGQVTDPNGARSTYLVMEYLPGPTLQRALAAGRLDNAEVAAIGADLASALAYVHASGVVHRDVKPANVLLSRGEDEIAAKLADFGIARMLDGTRVTATGMTVGTANYLSPEQARGAEAGPPSDVYSLGLVLLEALTGQIVYAGVGITAALARLSRAPDIPGDLGPAWCTLLRGMLDSDPLARPDAAQVRRALESVEVAAGADAATVTMPAARSTAILAAGQLTPEDPTVAVTRPAGAHRPDRRRWPARTLVVLLAAGSAAAVFAILTAFLANDASQAPTAPTNPSLSSPPSTSSRAQVAAPAGAAMSRGAASVPVQVQVTPLSKVQSGTAGAAAQTPSAPAGARTPGPVQGPGAGHGAGKAKKGHKHGGK